MKSAQLIALRRLEVRDVADPGLPAGGDVLLRMQRVGICGSDVHYYSDGRIGSQIVAYPWTVGHEGAAIVEAVGPDVTRVRAGDRVAIDPAMPCFACDQCLAGRPHTCRKLLFLGCPGQVEGCLSERFVLPETSCLPIPDEMPFEQAALVEPLSIALHGVALAPKLTGATVGVLGAGPIGLCTLMAAKEAGAAEVAVADKIEARVRIARECGASWAGVVTDAAALADLADRHDGNIDVVFECCGRQEAMDQALELLKPGGTLVLIGIPEPNRVSFDINLLRRKELAIVNVRRQNGCMERALRMIATGAIDAPRLITHRFSFADTPRAFDMVADYRDGVVKAMIQFN
jgi:L-iditol 2-dehydrogenase